VNNTNTWLSKHLTVGGPLNLNLSEDNRDLKLYTSLTNVTYSFVAQSHF